MHRHRADVAWLLDQAHLAMPRVYPIDNIMIAEKQDRALSKRYTNEKRNRITALTFLRDTNENPPGLPVVHRVPLLEHHDAWITRWTMDMDYTLEDPMQPWSVLSMLKIMQSQTRERIVGPGITDIFCMPIEGTYEHKKVLVPFGENVPVPL